MGKKARNQRRDAQRTQRALESRLRRLAEAVFEVAIDEGQPAEQAAQSLLLLYRGAHVPGEVAFAIAHRSSRERAQAVAEAAVAADPDELAAWSLAACVAEERGDDTQAARCYRRALEISDDHMTRWLLATALQGAGRHLEALQTIERMCREEPFDERAQELLRDSLREIACWLEGSKPDEPCPCGRDSAFADCCEPGARGRLSWFGDRRLLDDLAQALGDYARRPAMSKLHAIAEGRWAKAFGEDADGLERDLHGPSTDLPPFEEWSWLAADGGPEDEDEDEDDSWDDDDGPPDCIARFFEEDPTIDARLRDAADKLHQGRWGLWMAGSRDGGPGMWLVDVLSGQRVYAAIPEEQRREMPRWTVLLACLLPLDGIWRSWGGVLRTSPRQADLIAREVFDKVGDLIGALEGDGASYSYHRYGGYPPSAAAEVTDQATGHVAALTQLVAHGLVPQIAAALHGRRRALPAMTNTDGDPIEMIQAVIRVAGGEGCRAALAAHPDFDARDQEIVWEGRQLTGSEAAMMEAKRKELYRHHKARYDPSERPRYIRGVLKPEGTDRLAVEVNSRRRLEALVEILRDAGQQPVVVSTTTVDPVQDLGLGLPGGPPAAASEDPTMQAGIDAWAEAWIEESVPALDGMTPREAAQSEKGRLLLEGLLRDFEYRSDVNRARGVPDVDVAALRARLGVRSSGLSSYDL